MVEYAGGGPVEADVVDHAVDVLVRPVLDQAFLEGAPGRVVRRMRAAHGLVAGPRAQVGRLVHDGDHRVPGAELLVRAERAAGRVGDPYRVEDLREVERHAAVGVRGAEEVLVLLLVHRAVPAGRRAGTAFDGPDHPRHPLVLGRARV
jgi:hypothetical protein